MYTRASASDYDDFQAKGWTTKELIPLMRKHETYQRACNNRDIHGFEGPIKGDSCPFFPLIFPLPIFPTSPSLNKHSLTFASVIWQLHIPRDARLPPCRRVPRHPRDRRPPRPEDWTRSLSLGEMDQQRYWTSFRLCSCLYSQHSCSSLELAFSLQYQS